MRRAYFSVMLMLAGLTAMAQQGIQPTISAMRWGVDYNLHVKLSNDTNYVMDVRGLYHTGKNFFIDSADNSTTYYPVTLDKEFVDYIKTKPLEPDNQARADAAQPSEAKTLWSALHGSLGGGYIHFINCLVYTLESQQLFLNEPIMRRPVSSWKPKPMTESYRRTRKWDYYAPNNQKLARREYRLRKKENDLRDLQGIPNSFIELFLSTSQAKYERMRKAQMRRQVAQIDAVQLLLGAKYLGEEQIKFIRNRVRAAVMRYNVNTLPSVIIFDDYNAAVAMSLDQSGYKIDYIVFRDQESLSNEESQTRFNKIEALIKAINEANDRVFRKRLQQYYQKTRK